MSRYQLPPLSDEVKFEHLINVLCKKEYDDNNFQLYGRKGSSQHGIDGLSISTDKKLVVKIREIYP